MFELAVVVLGLGREGLGEDEEPEDGEVVGVFEEVRVEAVGPVGGLDGGGEGVVAGQVVVVELLQEVLQAPRNGHLKDVKILIIVHFTERNFKIQILYEQKFVSLANF